MIPPTWGRTSATRWADVRPGSSVVRVTFPGLMTTMPTSGGPPPLGFALFLFPHPASSSAPAMIPAMKNNVALRLVSISTSGIELNEHSFAECTSVVSA